MTNLQVSNRKNNEQRIGKNIENTVENIRKKSVGIVCKVAKKISQKCPKKTAKILRNSGLNNLMTASQKCKHRVQGSFKGFSQRTDI